MICSRCSASPSVVRSRRHAATHRCMARVRQLDEWSLHHRTSDRCPSCAAQSQWIPMNTPIYLVIGSTGKTGRRVTHRLIAAATPSAPSRRAPPRPSTGTAQHAWSRPCGIDRAYVTFFPDLAAPGASTRSPRSPAPRPTPACSGSSCSPAAASTMPCAASRSSSAPGSSTRSCARAGSRRTSPRASCVDGVRERRRPPAGDVREPFIDVDDIADVVVAASPRAARRRGSTR